MNNTKTTIAKIFKIVSIVLFVVGFVYIGTAVVLFTAFDDFEVGPKVFVAGWFCFFFGIFAIGISNMKRGRRIQDKIMEAQEIHSQSEREENVCPVCHKVNPKGSEYCSGCGSKLTITCPHCGAKNAGDNRFCNKCGESLYL